MPDDSGVGNYQRDSLDYEKPEYVEAEDDSEYTSLEYDPADDQLICGTPPNLREKRRMKARSMHAAKIAQERDIIAQLDQHKKRAVKDTTKSRSYDRTHKLQYADTDTSSQVPTASTNVVKVDTHRRIMCLNPKPVIKPDDSLSDNDAKPVAPTHISSFVPHCDCPSDRYDFYRTFSTLIRLGNAPKKEKEPKAGGSLFAGSPYTRQMSTEQELWQTHLCDLIWFELQAYINVRTNKDQDDYLCDARKGIDDILDRVMNFSASTVEKSKEQLSADSIPVECFCRSSQSGYSGTCLQQVISRQCAMSEVVNLLLDDIENAESLYPTQKAMALEHPVYAEDKFQRRIATLCLWMTITRDIAHKIKLMSEIVHISDQSLVGTAWSCIDLRCIKTLVSGYSGRDLCTADDVQSLPGDDVHEDLEGDGLVNSETVSDCDHVTSVPPSISRQKSVHFKDDHSAQSDVPSHTECRHSRMSRPNSTEVAPTSVYRLYVDALLKKTGLRKLLARLKDLLDTTLQRARLALLPSSYSCQHGISKVI